jgi:hypothetical protein
MPMRDQSEYCAMDNVIFPESWPYASFRRKELERYRIEATDCHAHRIPKQISIPSFPFSSNSGFHHFSTISSLIPINPIVLSFSNCSPRPSPSSRDCTIVLRLKSQSVSLNFKARLPIQCPRSKSNRARVLTTLQ